MRGAPKLTPEILDTVYRKVKEGLPRKRVAALAGISESTFYEWMRASSRPDAAPELIEFARKVEQAEAEFQESLLAIVKDALPRDPKLALAILGRRFPDEWGRRDNVQVDQTADREAEAKSLRERLLEQLEKLLPATVNVSVNVTPTDTVAPALTETASPSPAEPSGE